MKRICLIVTSFMMLCLFVGCGQSYEETKRISRTQRLKAMREDSAALKIAVMPTLDCLPVYLAEDHHLFDSVVDIRLKAYTAHMDIDTALTNRRVELGFTDLVRAERMKKQGAKLEYLSATNAYWMLVTNRTARITNLKHLDDKMIAMTRYSVTDLLAELAVDSAELKSERVFRIQINDVNVRLKMLENNEMDALLLTEPQLTQAVAMKARPLLDTRKLDMCMGAIVKQEKNMDDSKRKQQLDAFVKGYNRAADSINKYGVGHYADLVVKYCRVKQETVKALPITLKFNHIAPPREQDIERAQKWVEKH